MKEFLKSLAGETQVNPNGIRYAGFNVRMMANFIDMLMLMLLTVPFVYFAPGSMQLPADTPPQVVDAIHSSSSGQMSEEQFNKVMVESGYITNVFLPKMLMHTLANFFIVGAIFVFCWYKWNSTPGKLLLKLKIVDEKTLGDPSLGQCLIRYFGYFVSSILLFLGFLMIGFNKKKKGLHDMMAGTIVVHSNPLDQNWEDRKKKWRVYFTLFVILVGAIYLSSKL